MNNLIKASRRHVKSLETEVADQCSTYDLRYSVVRAPNIDE